MTKQEAIGAFTLECLRRGVRVRFDASDVHHWEIRFTLLHRCDLHDIEWKTVHALSEAEFDSQLATAAGQDELLRRATRIPEFRGRNV